MKAWAALFFFLFLSIRGSAQKVGQELVDSLVSEIPEMKSDSLKVRAVKRVADEYFFIDSDKALQYSRAGLKMAEQMKWERAIGTFSSSIARAYGDRGNYDSCLYYNKRALHIQGKAKDTINICTTLNNMGAAEQNLNSNFTGALAYYLESLKLSEGIENTYMMGNTLVNISGIYLAQKNYKKALSYAFKGLEVRKNLVDDAIVSIDREQGRSLTNIATIYTEMNDTLNARKYFHKALPLLEKVDDMEVMASVYTYLSMVYPRYSAMNLEYALKAEKLWNEVNPMHSDAINNLGSLGMIYLDRVRNGPPLRAAERKRNLDESEKYLRRTILLSDQKGDVDLKSYYRGVLAELQAETGDYKSAYLNFREFQKVQDSLFSQENKNNIAELEGRREIELRDKKIEINALELKAQKRQRLGLLIGLGFIVTIVGLLYWQNRIRKRNNQQLLKLNARLDEANKIKARFFAILSHDLRSPVANLVNFLYLQKEAPGLMTDEKRESHQKRIRESAENLLENMESMLLWSKSQMEHFTPQVRITKVHDLFEYIRKFFGSETQVSLSFDDPGGLQVKTDEDYLKTIMQNLTNNAIRALAHTPEGQVTWRAEKEEEVVILSIRDNGPGASEEQLSVLYEENFSPGTRSGLGLYVVRDLAKAIGCTIRVNRVPQGGMEFKLVLCGFS